MNSIGLLLNSIIYIILFFMGATVFSFLNLAIRNLPEKKKLSEKHSSCRFCGHEQKIQDVFPLISELRFKRSCRYCGEKSPLRELLIEIFGGIALCGLVFYYGIVPDAFRVFIVICVLTVITFVDIDTMEIPSILNIILLLLGAITALMPADGISITDRLIGMACISIPMIILILICNGFGGGDVKLMCASGLLLGWKGNIIAFFIGVILGGIYGIILLARKKKGRKDYFAFGPFLSVGIAIAVIGNFGNWLFNYYTIHFIFSYI